MSSSSLLMFASTATFQCRFVPLILLVAARVRIYNSLKICNLPDCGSPRRIKEPQFLSVFYFRIAAETICRSGNVGATKMPDARIVDISGSKYRIEGGRGMV